MFRLGSNIPPYRLVRVSFQDLKIKAVHVLPGVLVNYLGFKKVPKYLTMDYPYA